MSNTLMVFGRPIHEAYLFGFCIGIATTCNFAALLYVLVNRGVSGGRAALIQYISHIVGLTHSLLNFWHLLNSVGWLAKCLI